MPPLGQLLFSVVQVRFSMIKEPSKRTTTTHVVALRVANWEVRERDIPKRRHARLNCSRFNLGALGRRCHNAVEGDKSIKDNRGVHV